MSGPPCLPPRAAAISSLPGGAATRPRERAGYRRHASRRRDGKRAPPARGRAASPPRPPPRAEKRREATARLFLKRFASAAGQSHKTETRISAMMHFARKGKREKKALLLFLFVAKNFGHSRDSEKIFYVAMARRRARAERGHRGSPASGTNRLRMGMKAATNRGRPHSVASSALVKSLRC